MTHLKREGRACLRRLEKRLFRLERLFASFKALSSEKGRPAWAEQDIFKRDASPSPELQVTRDTLAEMQRKHEQAESLLLQKDAELQEARKALAKERDEAERLRSLLKKQEERYAILWNKLDLAKKDAELARDKSREEVASLKELLLPRQEQLAAIWRKLEELSPEGRKVAGRHFDLQNPLAFLPALGFFSRIEQLWDVCASLARQNELPPDMPGFMQMALELYNAANPDSKAALCLAETGSPYDYNSQDRLGPSGVRVSLCVLPGLLRPTGQLCKKALVSLK